MTIWDWFGLTLVLVVIGTLVLLVIVIFRRLFRSKKKPMPTKSTPSWVWLFLLSVVGLVTYISSGRSKVDPAAAPQRTQTWVVPVLISVAVVGSIAVIIGRQFYKTYDRAASRALKRGQAGDAAGAIAELRAAMEGRQPSEARPDDETTPWILTPRHSLVASVRPSDRTRWAYCTAYERNGRMRISGFVKPRRSADASPIFWSAKA